MWALKVKKEFAEHIRLLAFKRRLVDTTYKFIKHHEHVYIPLKRKPTSEELNRLIDTSKLSAEGYQELDGNNKVIELLEYNFTVANPITKYVPYNIIHARLEQHIPHKLLTKLPSHWEKVGDIIILKLDDELTAYSYEIGRTYAEVLGASTVVQDLRGVAGKFRTPVGIVRLYGERTVTIHVENGIKYKLDVEKLMFSSGNIDERVRMASLNCSDEIIVDMFAGIGYFTLPLAKYTGAKKVYACELNPIAYRYLCDNIRLNKVGSKVVPLKGDNRDVAPDHIADRVVMGYLHDTYEYLPKAIRTLMPEGGTIHYHEVCPEELLMQRPLARIEKVAAQFGRKVKLLKFRIVKSYAPRIYHAVLDVAIT
jgi:tRNA wybutosine-synthesizing protein 2